MNSIKISDKEMASIDAGITKASKAKLKKEAMTSMYNAMSETQRIDFFALGVQLCGYYTIVKDGLNSILNKLIFWPKLVKAIRNVTSTIEGICGFINPTPPTA